MSNRTLQALYVVEREGHRVVRIFTRTPVQRLIVAGPDAPRVYDELLKLTSAIEVADARANLAVSERDRVHADNERLNRAVADLQDEVTARRDNEIGMVDELGKDLGQLHAAESRIKFLTRQKEQIKPLAKKLGWDGVQDLGDWFEGIAKTVRFVGFGDDKVAPSGAFFFLKQSDSLEAR